MQTSEVNLRKIKLGLFAVMGEEMMESLNDAELKVYRDAPTRDMVLQLKASVWGQDGTVIDIEYPTTWWDAFCLRWMPKAINERFPPDVTRHHISADIIYPSINIAMPKEKHHLRLFHTTYNGDAQ